MITGGICNDTNGNIFESFGNYSGGFKGDGTSGKFVHLGSNSNSGTSENIQERNRVKVNDLVNLSQGEFYGIIAEGNPREFLKTQFARDEIKGKYINQKIPVNAEMMKENYIKIILECKEIFK